MKYLPRVSIVRSAFALLIGTGFVSAGAAGSGSGAVPQGTSGVGTQATRRTQAPTLAPGPTLEDHCGT